MFPGLHCGVCDGSPRAQNPVFHFIVLVRVPETSRRRGEHHGTRTYRVFVNVNCMSKDIVVSQSNHRMVL